MIYYISIIYVNIWVFWPKPLMFLVSSIYFLSELSVWQQPGALHISERGGAAMGRGQ